MNHVGQRVSTLVYACVACSHISLTQQAKAQDHEMAEAPVPSINPTDLLSTQEKELWGLVIKGSWIKTRAHAERLLRGNGERFFASFVLSLVHEEAENNLPKALYFAEKGLQLFEAEYGTSPIQMSRVAALWHREMVSRWAALLGTLERYDDRLGAIDYYNARYEPKMVGERAWVLMKLGKFDEARAAAHAALQMPSSIQKALAHNALCAIEFESGNDIGGYEACDRAVQFAKRDPELRRKATAVDLANLAEAARALFKLEDAEKILQEATESPAAWHGNPWVDLAELYLREGRFAEAVSSLRQVPGYQSQRPPHLRLSDIEEHRRVMSEMFYLVGRFNDAGRTIEQSIQAPDRRGYSSRDPMQDRAIAYLLSADIHRAQIEVIHEQMAQYPWWNIYRRGKLWLQAGAERWHAWYAEKQASRVLGLRRLRGIFQVGTAKSAIIAPWLVGDLTRMIRPALLQALWKPLRMYDKRPSAAAYYRAFEAESMWRQSKRKSIPLLAKARHALPEAERTLRWKLTAMLADAAWDESHRSTATSAYLEVMRHDPGVLRRLGLSLPVTIRMRGNYRGSQKITDALERSPRVEISDSDFVIELRAQRTGMEVCMLGPQDEVLGCAPTQLGRNENETVKNVLSAVHEELFAPRVELSQTDAMSLDGSNRMVRNPLQGLMGPP